MSRLRGRVGTLFVVLAMGLGLFGLGFGLTPPVAAQGGSSTLKVDLAGSWNAAVTVELWDVSDPPTKIWAYSNQHGGPRTYTVTPGTYTVKLVQGPQVWSEVLTCDDQATCEVTGHKQTLTVDLSGSWNAAVTVALHKADPDETEVGDVIWTVSNQHGAARTYNVLTADYELALSQGVFQKVVPALCASGTCSAGDVVADLAVNLEGAWNAAVSAQLKTESGTEAIWTVSNQHGAPRTYKVLKGSYRLALSQGPQTWVSDVLNCNGDTCEVTGHKQTLTVDLSGSWNAAVSAQLKTNSGDVIWTVSNQHGDKRTYNVLRGSYKLALTQGPQTWESGTLACNDEACVVEGHKQTLPVDLSGSWNAAVTVALHEADPDTTKVGDVIWSVSNQHGAERNYNVLTADYEVVFTQGAFQKVVAANCSASETCAVGNVVADLAVDLSGSWNAAVSAQLKTDGAAVIWTVSNQHGAARSYKVLKGNYKLALSQGPQTWESDVLDCTGDNCTVVDHLQQLTVDLSGSWNAAVTVALRKPATSDLIWSASNQHGAVRTYNVLTADYEVVFSQGPFQKVAAAPCASGICSAGDVVAALSINLSGNWDSSITTRLHLDDGQAGTLGAQLWSASNQHGAERTYNVLKGTYDVAVAKGGKDYAWDSVNCTGETCATGKSTLTVKFPNIASVHTYLRRSDGKPGEATGQQVGQQTYKDNEISFAGLDYGFYDVVLVKGAQTKIVDNVTVLGSSPILDGIVATLKVEFPGISSVHTYVKTTGGGAVDERTYKNEETSLAVLKASYKVIVVKGAQQNSYDVDCSADTCTLTGIVATLKVEFPGISSVHTYVKTTGGGAVDERTYKNGEATLSVLKAPYKVIVVKGAQQTTYDVNCSAGDCTLSGITANLKVEFTGISSVHTYVRANDGKPDTVGGAVDERTYKTDRAELTVLKGSYDLVVVKGAQQNAYHALDCSGDTCTLSDITADLTVSFPGIASVHTYVKTIGGGAVDERTYKTGEATLKVLKAPYKVIVVKGAQQNTYDVDCTSGTCSVSGTVSSFTLHFPGKSSVHVYLRKDDGATGTATGGAVDQRTYQNNQTTIPALKGTYDVVVTFGGASYILDAVSLTNDAAVYTVAIVKLLNSSGAGIVDGAAEYYAGSWQSLGTTAASGVISRALPGAPANYNFAMTYAGGRQEKWQNLGGDCVVVFQTRSAVVELRDSGNSFIGGTHGPVQYYAGGSWRTFGGGNTAGGSVSMQLLPLNYNFALTYAGARQEKWQNVASSPTVLFKTVNATVELRDSGSNLIAGTHGPVEYYAGGSWRTFGGGNIVGGSVSMQLLPLNYNFALTYAGARQEKWQDLNSNATVPFKTTNVVVQLKDHSDALIPDSTGTGVVQYYAGGSWRTFGGSTTSGGSASMELLPLNYNFAMTYAGARQEKWQSVSGKDAMVIYKTGQVDSASNTCTHYYAGGSWRPFSDQMELLPLQYNFRFSSGSPTEQWITINGGVVNTIR